MNSTRSYNEKLLSSIDGQLISILAQAKQSKEDADLTEIEIFLPQHCPELTSRLIFAKLSERCSVTSEYAEVYPDFELTAPRLCRRKASALSNLLAAASHGCTQRVKLDERVDFRP